VSIVTVLIDDIAKGQEIELLLPVTSSSIDGEKDGPGNAASDEADSDGDLEIAKEEEAIERMVIEDVAIWNLKESPQPVEKALGKIRRAFSVIAC